MIFTLNMRKKPIRGLWKGLAAGALLALPGCASPEPGLESEIKLNNALRQELHAYLLPTKSLLKVIQGPQNGNFRYTAGASQYGTRKELRINVEDRENGFDFMIYDFDLDGIVDSAAIFRPIDDKTKVSKSVKSPEEFNKDYHKAVREIISLIRK